MSEEFRVLIVLTGMFTIPGWALLAATRCWRDWSPVQRWFLAISLSTAVYPVMFYSVRSVTPGFSFGPAKLAGFLLVAAGIALWRLYGNYRDQVSFDRWDWAVISILCLTLFTRFWILRGLPYPAWSDGMHHTILTHMTALGGRLPFSMEPFFPVPLGQYHLGLYALSGTAEQLARVPAHTAVQYTAQYLNALCIIGVFLVLDRMCGRIGAIAGAAVAGLISFQPAFYVNYGRFTQLAAQTVLLPAWIMTRHALRTWRDRARGSPVAPALWYGLLAGVLNAAVFLLHFRVAALYLPLLLILVLWESVHSVHRNRTRAFLSGVALIGIVSLLFVSPAVWKALQIYVQNRSATATAGPALPGLSAAYRQAYFGFPLKNWSRFAAPEWLLLLGLISALFAAIRGSKLAMTALIWAAAMVMTGGAYLLRVPLLELTNMGAVALMMYLPISLALGAGTEEFLRGFEPGRRERASAAVLMSLAAAAFVGSHTQVMRVEPYRHFVTDGDLAAMTWIRENTPPDALFAINTYFWMPGAPMGTDGGYWIPYCTGRPTTAACSIFDLGNRQYTDRIIRLSTSAKRLEMTNDALGELRTMGVRYVYVGVKGSFDGPGLLPEKIIQAPGIETVYRQRGVTILKVGD